MSFGDRSTTEGGAPAAGKPGEPSEADGGGLRARLARHVARWQRLCVETRVEALVGEDADR